MNLHFDVSKSELGGVFMLQTDTVKNKLPYQTFKEKLTNYVMKNLDGVKNLKFSILHLKNPFELLEKDEPIGLRDKE